MAWNLLFGSDFGLLSLGTILFIIVMAIYFGLFFSKKIKEDERSGSKN